MYEERRSGASELTVGDGSNVATAEQWRPPSRVGGVLPGGVRESVST